MLIKVQNPGPVKENAGEKCSETFNWRGVGSADPYHCAVRMAVLPDEHAEAHWAAWARSCAERISLGDPCSFERVTGAYGGMGSLSDVMLWRPSGKSAADRPLLADYPPSAEIDRLRSEAYRLAAQILADISAEGDAR
jgi:hypothetical protein